jgi:POT family proton-dependent oligopeptide transporter
MFKQHPKGLYVLFFTEMWERFSYYGMRAILALYMINALIYDTAFTSSIYGYYTGLVYLTPLLGGYVADKYWGNRRSIIFGSIVMALGQFGLAISGYMYSPGNIPDVAYSSFIFNPQQIVFILGLVLLVFGNGFFKPNISTMVGSLYPEGDKRRDSAFTIFYMGINLGALLSPLVAGGLGDTGNPADFKYGFLAAGIGMILGLIVFMMGKNKHLRTPDGEPVGMVPEKKQKLAKGEKHHPPLTKGEKERIAVIFILAFFVIFFWAAFEQAGVSLTFFADQMTDRVVTWLDNWIIPASWFQSINPIAIVLFAPLFASLWTKLADKGREPSSPVKMALGLFLLSLGFVLLIPAAQQVDAGSKVGPLWLVGAYSLYTFGELCLSPIGLSMVTKLSPIRFASLLMGVWFLANAAANWLAGQLSTLYPDPSRADVSSLFGFVIDDFTSFFTIFIVMSLAASFILFVISKKLIKMMHGVT